MVTTFVRAAGSCTKGVWNFQEKASRGLKDPRKCSHFLGELWNLNVDVAAVQDTHFTYAADCRVLEDDFVIFSAYGSRSSIEVSLLVGRSLNADANFDFADDGDRLVEVDVAINGFEFRVAAAYAFNIAAERFPFFDGWRRL